MAGGAEEPRNRSIQGIQCGGSGQWPPVAPATSSLTPPVRVVRLCGRFASLDSQQEGKSMKTIVALLVVISPLPLSMGCGSTPAYSARERGELISRTINYEGAQAMDDL